MASRPSACIAPHTLPQHPTGMQHILRITGAAMPQFPPGAKQEGDLHGEGGEGRADAAGGAQADGAGGAGAGG